MEFIIRKFDSQKEMQATLLLAIEQWNWYCDHSKYYWWVASLKERPEVWAAYGGLSVFDRETLYLGPDMVLEEYRGNGLQRKLVEQRKIFGRENAYKSILAITRDNNVYSINNLVEMGFRIRDGWSGTSKKNELYWELKL